MEPKACPSCGTPVYYAALGKLGILENGHPAFAGYAYDTTCSACGGAFIVFEK